MSHSSSHRIHIHIWNIYIYGIFPYIYQKIHAFYVGKYIPVPWDPVGLPVVRGARDSSKFVAAASRHVPGKGGNGAMEAKHPKVGE